MIIHHAMHTVSYYGLVRFKPKNTLYEKHVGFTTVFIYFCIYSALECIFRILDMFGIPSKNGHSYGPNTIYIHKNKVPYPYYMLQPHCEMNTDYRGPITPYIILPLLVLGTVLLFSIFTVGLLLIIERARLTPVIRARVQSLQSDSGFNSLEQLVTKAVEVYNKLNDY